jgi:hypothetical protein
VTYNGQPVAKNLSLLKGFLMNTGGKDITSDMVVKPLQMGLAEGYRWIEASAKSSSNPEANVKIIDPKTVEFSLGFFRCGEFLRFEGIIEVEEGKQWAGAVWLDHRIADTSAVKYEKVPEKPEQHWRMFGQLLTPISFIVVMFVSDLKRQQPTPMLFTTAIMAGAMCLIIGLPLATNRKAKKRRKILMLN